MLSSAILRRTTGTAYTMHASGLGHEEAIRACQMCRSVVDPIHGLKDLLAQLENAQRHHGRR